MCAARRGYMIAAPLFLRLNCPFLRLHDFASGLHNRCTTDIVYIYSYSLYFGDVIQL